MFGRKEVSPIFQLKLRLLLDLRHNRACVCQSHNLHQSHTKKKTKQKKIQTQHHKKIPDDENVYHPNTPIHFSSSLFSNQVK